MVKLKKNGNYVEMWCEPTPYLESVRGNGTLFTSSVGIKFKSMDLPDIDSLYEDIIYLIGDMRSGDTRVSQYHLNEYLYEDIIKSFMEFEEFIKKIWLS